MLMKNYVSLQYIFRLFIILFILRQLLAVQGKQFFAIFFESRNQTYDFLKLRRRYNKLTRARVMMCVSQTGDYPI